MQALADYRTMSISRRLRRVVTMTNQRMYSQAFVRANIASMLFRADPLSRYGHCTRNFICSHSANDTGARSGQFSLAAEMEEARRQARPYNIDKSKLTPIEREQLRIRSRSIPMVADKEPLEVLFEDDRFLVVNKPSFLKMHPSHRFEGGSLLNRAIGHCGFAPKLLHRLDMHTTGVVLLAKKKELCKSIMQQFMFGQVKKEYLCVVDGLSDKHIGESFEVDEPIQRHSVSFVREVGTSGEDSKPAQTLYTILDKSVEKKMMLLRAEPQTGRTHQIRVHAKECDLPIVGDDLYNAKEHDMYASYEEISTAAKDKALTRYGDCNPLRVGLKLHAWKIALKDPEGGKPLHFCAPPPTHMRDILEWAGMAVPKA